MLGPRTASSRVAWHHLPHSGHTGQSSCERLTHGARTPRGGAAGTLTEAAVGNPFREKLNHEYTVPKQTINYSLYLPYLFLDFYGEKTETSAREYYRFYLTDKENKAQEISVMGQGLELGLELLADWVPPRFPITE